MEKIATDIYTFSRLREEGFTYVDKTEELYAMASGEVGSQFFMARPRRFGKSLAVSTLKYLFEGRRDLFSGLKIEPKWDWAKKWPVLHLDMGSAQTVSVDQLHSRWRELLSNECSRNGIPFRDDENPATVFERVVNDLAAKSPDGRMVLLVDEYDKPLLGHLMKSDVTVMARFEEKAKLVINPVSLGLCFSNGKFSDYWSSTAVPTFLIDILKKTPLDFSTVDISDSTLNAYEPDNPQIVTLLYQTGYLTIKSFRQMGARRRYELKFPNHCYPIAEMV